jgi:hypothetical protein
MVVLLLGLSKTVPLKVASAASASLQCSRTDFIWVVIFQFFLYRLGLEVRVRWLLTPLKRFFVAFCLVIIEISCILITILSATTVLTLKGCHFCLIKPSLDIRYDLFLVSVTY